MSILCSWEILMDVFWANWLIRISNSCWNGHLLDCTRRLLYEATFTPSEDLQTTKGLETLKVVPLRCVVWMRRWVSRCELCGMRWLPTSTFMMKMPSAPVVTWNKLRRGDTDRCGKCCNRTLQPRKASEAALTWCLMSLALKQFLRTSERWWWSVRQVLNLVLFVFPSDSSMPLRGSQRRYFPRPSVAWRSSDSMTDAKTPV